MSGTLTATGRGLYGQNEGNESRSTAEWVEDRIHENWIAEGDWLKPMIAAAEEGNMQEMERLRNKMKEVYVEGGVEASVAQERADTVLRQAMGRLRIGGKPLTRSKYSR